MLSFLVRQIVIAINKKNTLTYPTSFVNRPEAFSETRLSDKELWNPDFREDRYHSEKESHAAPSVTIKAKHADLQKP